jgi:type II secretory pathway pseudopilin PulG
VRWILLVILGALALLIVAALFVIGEVQRIDALTVANKDRAVTGQAQRAQDEQAAAAREDAKVAQLACSLVSLVEVGKNPQIDQLRLRYNCTPTAAGTPTAEGQPSSLPTSPRPTGPSAPTPSPGPSR